MRQPLVLDCRTLGVEQLQYELDQRYREGWRVVAAWPGLLFLERGVPAVATAAAVYRDDLHAAELRSGGDMRRSIALTVAALALLALGGCVVEPAHLVPDNGGGWHHHHDWR